MGAERLAAEFERGAHGGAVIRMAGKLDRATAPLLGGMLSALRGETETVVIDLSGVDHIDGTGLALLLHAEAQPDGWAPVEVTGVRESLRHHRHRLE
ncbi:MAG: STAS domain-containing protein [Solirubrobacteraceae bacterium]